MEIINLTTGMHVSRSMRWDNSYPFVKGNAVSSRYSTCESSRVPIYFSCDNFTYIVGEGQVYRIPLCENKERIQQKMEACVEWRCRHLYNDDLKTIISQDNWETMETKMTFVKEENYIQEVEVLNFDRGVTWHFGVIPVGKCFQEDEILLQEGDFIFTEKNAYFRKNNDEYLKIFNHMVETFEYKNNKYKIAEFKGRFCLFTEIEGKTYGYEFNDELGLPEALEYIQKKAYYDKVNNSSVEEAIDWLVQSQVELTVNDSYAVGNCKPGTKVFLEKYFQGKQSLVIDKSQKPFILVLANENILFANVLKRKYVNKI